MWLGLFPLLLSVQAAEHCPRACRCGQAPSPTAVCDSGGLDETAFLEALAILPKDIEVLRVTAPPSNPNNFSVTLDLLRFDSLRELHLANCGLTSLGKRVFASLRSLRVLSVPGNSITFLSPDTFEGTEHLLHLNLARNSLNQGLLPTGAFAYLPRLESLDLSDNDIRQFPGNLLLGLDNLRVLNLEGNEVTNSEIAGLLSDTPKLQELRLRGAPLGSLHSDLFHNIPELQSLTIADAGLTSIPVKAVQALKELRTLDLSDNKIASIHPYALADASTRITSLNLAGNLLGNGQHQLSNGPRINRLDDYGIHQKAFANSSLVSLDLSRNGYAYFSATVLGPVAASLRILSLSDNLLGGIEEEQVSGLALRDLHVSSIGMTALPPWLPYEFRQLRLLNVSGNPITHIPAGFAAALLPELRQLDISHCGFTSLGPHGLALLHSPNMDAVRLAANPWHCDCQTQPLIHFLRSPQAQSKAAAMQLDQVQCAAPRKLVGRRLDEITEPSECSIIFGAASGLTQRSELGILIAAVLATLLLLSIAALIGCYARLCSGSSCSRGRSYRTREGSKGHLSPSSSEPSEPDSSPPHPLLAPAERLF